MTKTFHTRKAAESPLQQKDQKHQVLHVKDRLDVKSLYNNKRWTVMMGPTTHYEAHTHTYT